VARSTMPVRGRRFAPAAAAAALFGLPFAAPAAAQSTGGFSAEAEAPLTARTANATLHTDRRTAIAPVGAPPAVVRAIGAANRITRKPYKWGGGHGRWSDTGYDCSGAVSYVLHAAGLLRTARDSTGFMSYGWAGPGQWISIYAHGGHAYMTIAGLRFDTSGRGEQGPRWRLERRSGGGFAVRHPSRL
jgi:cell wall-associated NlpC family hydrolase